MANFKTVVEGNRGRADHWNQSHFIGGQKFGAGGICGPLVAKWIKDRKHKISFPKDMKTNQEAREEVMQLKLNQHTRQGDYVSEYLQLFGLYKHFTQNFPGEVSINQLMTVVTSGPGYYFVVLSTHGLGANIEGHAFAIDMFDLKFFDPNFGQASFDNVDDLKRCFTEWFRLIYLTMVCTRTGITLRSIPAGNARR